jgi:tRNA pseudouridine38-40 synthase
MRRIALKIAYDGTDFAGFQFQPNQRTVQGDLEAALSKHCKEPIRVSGAGRTDAGVHAKGQVAHFDTQSPTPPDRYPEALGKWLPKDVAVLGSREVPGDFHARFSATRRMYRYAILPGRRDPILGRFAWMPKVSPDWERFGEDAARFRGEHDFQSFRIMGVETTTLREIQRIELSRIGPGAILKIEANAFLRGMVRWIVATLWARATSRMSDGEFGTMLSGGPRPETLVQAPPQGLCLVGVRYENRRTR